MIYIILNLLIIPATISFLYITVLKRKDKLLRLSTAVFLIDMVANVYFLIVNDFSLITLTADMLLSEFYIAFIILIFITNMLSNIAIDLIRKKGKVHIYYVSTFLMVIVASIASIYFIWLLSTSGRMDFITFMYNLETPVNTNIVGFYEQVRNLLFFCALMLVCIVYIFTKGAIFEKIKHTNRKQTPIATRIMLACIPCLLLLYVGYLPYYSFHMESSYEALFVDEPFPREHYIDPSAVELTWPSEKRNLVYLFVESYEASYFSKELGGLSNDNLLPNMTSLMKEGTFFSNHEDRFGGYQSMPYTDWTIGGMVTATSGILHKLAGEYRDDPNYCLVPGVTTLMDLLAEQGYNRKYITGTPSYDYNIGPFYTVHQVPVADYNTLREDGSLPTDYHEWFGFEDSKLYEFAKEDITELAQQEQPFLYIMNTNDTHSPEGYIDKTCKKEFNLDAENSIACADQMISEFVTWLKQQPYYENTTVVIVGDHISHENLLTKSFPDSEQENRRVFNLILNAESPETVGSQYNRDFWSADLFPTVLSAMNVKIGGNKLGLGSNLFSDVPTLIEVYGRDVTKDLLTRNSSFYYEKYQLDD